MLESAGFVNSFLITGGDGLSLVDTGPARSFEAMRTELRDNGFDLREVARVVVTHAHPDHAGGLSALEALSNPRIYAHPEDAGILTGEKDPYRFQGTKGSLLRLITEKAMSLGPVERVQPIEPGTPIRGLARWQVLHTPGHTPGSISLYEPAAQVLLCGDLLSNRGGRLHAPEATFNTDEATLRSSIETASALDTDILGCGHGPLVRGGAFRYIEAVLARRGKTA